MSRWKVPYVDLPKHFEQLEGELTDAFKDVMRRGAFILRDDVQKFEENMQTFLGVKHAIGVNSGTDALYLATHATGLKEGDEVITVAHSFVATLASITNQRAKPILIDINDDFNIDVSKLEQAVSKKTKAIIPVHLNGRVCKMDEIMRVAEKHHLIVIEDAAQAIGAKYKGKNAGNFGYMGCFSTHPMKTLHCAGDGGFITTNDTLLADRLRMLRNHAQRTKTELEGYGFNSRLDNLQAALLNVNFKYLPKWIERRREIASAYNSALNGLPIILPPSPTYGEHFDTFNSYVIRVPEKREVLREYLTKEGIEVFTHIGTPLHHHPSLGLTHYSLPNNERICKEILSLPVNPQLDDSQVDYVIKKVNNFFK